MSEPLRCERMIFSTEIHKMRCERRATFSNEGRKLCTQHSKMEQKKAWLRSNIWIERKAIRKSKEAVNE